MTGDSHNALKSRCSHWLLTAISGCVPPTGSFMLKCFFYFSSCVFTNTLCACDIYFLRNSLYELTAAYLFSFTVMERSSVGFLLFVMLITFWLRFPNISRLYINLGRQPLSISISLLSLTSTSFIFRND